MRMWMIDPSLLCRQHLLGEHAELHRHRHSFVKGHSIAGRRGQIEPDAMQARHDELADEMVRRGYQHKSPYSQPDLSSYSVEDRCGKVDKAKSSSDLADRCRTCRERMKEK